MRIALGIEYDGANYHGWQRQLDVVSVQGELEKALSKIANQPIEVFCAGRTDAGVHGTGQVVHFDVDSNRKLAAWTMGVNTHLPKDIAVRWAHEVTEDFHARFSATARRYRYIISNHAFRPAILARGVSHYHGELDEKLMHQAAQYLLGEHDFTSFRATHCQANTPFRHMHHINITRHGQYIVIDIKANAFLHHMVRNITGSLIKVGRGEEKPEWIEWLLQQKNRQIAGVTAKAEGLYLIEVDYPAEHGLPHVPAGPLFIED
ncbi:tRNA pseudouridine(38-40) synthase TruA [Photobacterium kagoshimensis]|uniref:tRNA pseudouridine(38-40) synthase TruA n=1 Tax=Photobacterium kagoshimensis TaxID=2910242 RepID=UPI003D0B1F1D